MPSVSSIINRFQNGSIDVSPVKEKNPSSCHIQIEVTPPSPSAAKAVSTAPQLQLASESLCPPSRNESVLRATSRPPMTIAPKMCPSCNLSRHSGKYCSTCGGELIDATVNPVTKKLTQNFSQKKSHTIVAPRGAVASTRFATLGGAPDKCARCTKTVYFAERRSVCGRVYHSKCVRCMNCNVALTSKMDDRNGEIFCSGCYASEFGPTGYGSGTTRRASAVSSLPADN